MAGDPRAQARPFAAATGRAQFTGAEAGAKAVEEGSVRPENGAGVDGDADQFGDSFGREPVAGQNPIAVTMRGVIVEKRRADIVRPPR